MEFCRDCGAKLNQNQEFCPQCGIKVERTQAAVPSQSDQSRTSSKPKQPIFKNKKSKILALIGVLVLAVLISGYFIGRQMTSPEAVVEAFIEGVKKKDAATVTKMLNGDHMEIEIDEEQTKAFLNYVQDNPRVLTSISEGLRNDVKKLEGSVFLNKEEETASLVVLTENGSKWMVFDDYAVKIQTFYLDVASDLEQTDLFINDEKTGIIEDEETFGPLLPGKYVVKAVYEGDYGMVEQQEKIDTSTLENETANLDFKWSEFFIPVASNYEDAVLYVNNQSTKMQVGELAEIGPVPLDGSVKVSVQKKFKDKVRKSEEIPLTEKVARADLAIDYQEIEPEPKTEPKHEPKPEPKQAHEPVRVVINNIPSQNSEWNEETYPTEEYAIQDAILYHYSSISEDNYRAAYDLFSSERKSKVTFAGWEKGLKDNIQDVVTTLNITEINGGTAKAYLEMTSYDQQTDDEILVQEWKGTWKLVKESDGWRLHSADIEKTSSWTE
ncbi:MAG: zinc ribbon domain-containing protein [Bacillota bacterium]